MNPEAWVMDRSVRLMVVTGKRSVHADVVKDPVTHP